jgi:hypothetical protein
MQKTKEQMNRLQNNPEGFWFKKRIYGWGWTPVKWQGWATIVIFGILIWMNAMSLVKNPTQTDIAWYIGRFIVVIALLFAVCYATSEGLKSQKGKTN